MSDDHFDYSVVCGSWADRDGDGTVDLCECLNEQYEYDLIMQELNKGRSVHRHYNRDDDEDDDDLFCDDDDDDDTEDIMSIFNSERAYYPVAKTVRVKACVQDKYYDREEREYLIGDAIYDFFPEIRESFEKRECKNYCALFRTVYTVNRELAVKIWLWILEKFTRAIVNKSDSEYDPQGSTITDRMLGLFDGIDKDSYDDDYIFDFLSEHPELENLIFATSFKEDYIATLDFYLIYCIVNNKKESFERVYRGILSNPFRKEEKTSSYSILENVVVLAHARISEGDVWFYNFLKKEIESLGKPIKEQYLLKNLNGERYDIPTFLKE